MLGSLHSSFFRVAKEAPDNWDSSVEHKVLILTSYDLSGERLVILKDCDVVNEVSELAVLDSLTITK